MDTVILSQDDSQVTFDVYNIESVYSATLIILDKEISGTLDNESGFLTVLISSITDKIQLPMCYCHIRVELVDTTIVDYTPTMLALVPVL
jgi:hypothetical protein